MTPDIMPFVHVRGTWGEMGAQVGQMFAPLIERHVEAWLEHVVRETGASRDDALATAASYAAPIQAHAPFLWEELQGMARGSQLPMNQLLLLQARAEVMRLSKDRVAPPTFECTTFAVGGRRTANGAVLYGQNVDLVPFLSEYSICAHPFEGRNVQTVASLIGDLTLLEMHLTKGSPCQSAYATYTLATCQRGSISEEVRDRFLEGAGSRSV